MGAQWGNSVKLTIFGESHGAGIGIVIDGIKPGTVLDMEYINAQMGRRAPGKNRFSTARREKDAVVFLSGVVDGITTGAPICGFIKNEDKKSKDYSLLKEVMRPGHSDYPANIKYCGYNDVRGGGHFSGRLTAPLVFAGSIAKQVLKEKGIEIYARISSIGNIRDDLSYEIGDLICKKDNIKAQCGLNSSVEGEISSETKGLVERLREISQNDFPVLDKIKEQEMREAIENARMNLDSVGGTIECFAFGVPAGIGDPFFNSLESTISHIIFSVPAVKGIEFGKGFEMASMLGSEANDEYYYDGEEVKTYSNNNGGILGGITNGMPLDIKVAIKPTPSIGKKQKTINIKEHKNCELEIEGRHDPCIVPRAVVVIESVVALAILDQMGGCND